MHESWYMNMKKIMNRTRSFYQFPALGTMVLIQTRSLKPQECNGIVIWPWNALESWFQFWKISQKVQSCLWFWTQLRGFQALGFDQSYMSDGLGLKNMSKTFCIDGMNIWFSCIFFQIFFTCFWFQSWPIFPIWVVHESWVNHEWLYCIKRFDHIGLVFFPHFN